MNYDDISSDEFIDDVELIENRTKKVRTSRPPRSGFTFESNKIEYFYNSLF